MLFEQRQQYSLLAYMNQHVVISLDFVPFEHIQLLRNDFRAFLLISVLLQHLFLLAALLQHVAAIKRTVISQFQTEIIQNFRKEKKKKRGDGLLNMLYHALTRILTSPSWGSGMAFLVTLSLFKPPKPESSTARISLESGALTALSGSFAPFFSIICSVSSAVSVPSFAIAAGRLTVLRMLLQQLLQRDFSCSLPGEQRSSSPSLCYYQIYGRDSEAQIP